MPAGLLQNVEAVIELDITAMDAVHQLCDELDRRGVVAALARVKQDPLPDLRGSGLVERIGPDHIFPTLRPLWPPSTSTGSSSGRRALQTRHDKVDRLWRRTRATTTVFT